MNLARQRATAMDPKADPGPSEPSRSPRSTALRPSQTAPVAELGRLLGTDLSAITLHPNSPQACGRIHALTDGDDIHFAPGQFAPGTERGDRLIAHELAHVAQQHRPGPPAPELAAELDADAAAAAVSRGHAARPRASLAARTVHTFEAWEHRQLGDEFGGVDRKIRLPNGAELTYGQIVALSGDFYRSPEALLRAPRSELDAIVREMGVEQSKVSPVTHRPSDPDAASINAAYEFATTGHSRVVGPATTLAGDPNALSGPHGEVREGEHVESGAPGAEASFYDLADVNPAHFSPDNITLNWIPKHQLALDLARQAWQDRHPGATPAPIVSGQAPSVREGTLTAALPARAATAAEAAAAAPGRPDPSAVVTPAGLTSAEPTASSADQHESQAWLASAFSDHFLTDAFASGHLISGDRSIYSAYYTLHRLDIELALWDCARADGMPGGLAAAFIAAVRGLTYSHTASLLLKIVHDYYNHNGITVRNALGQVWHTVGDTRLGTSPATIAMGSLASKASRDAVQDVLATGGTQRAQAALDYIPDMAQASGGGFLPIATFARAPAVLNPVLARSQSHSPASNDFYQLLKSNILPTLGLKTQQLGRWIGAGVSSATRTITSIPGRVERAAEESVHELESWPGRAEEEIYRLYGVPH